MLWVKKVKIYASCLLELTFDAKNFIFYIAQIQASKDNRPINHCPHVAIQLRLGHWPCFLMSSFHYECKAHRPICRLDFFPIVWWLPLNQARNLEQAGFPCLSVTTFRGHPGLSTFSTYEIKSHNFLTPSLPLFMTRSTFFRGLKI